MKPEIKTIVKALKTALENSDKLTFLTKIYLGRDIVKLLQTAEYPFANIVIDQDLLNIDKADNMRDFDMVRNSYGFRLQYAVRNETEDMALLGVEDTDGAIQEYGILDVIDAIHEALSDNKTLNETVDGIVITNTKSQVFSPEPDSLFYIAGAETGIRYNKDVWNDIDNR